MNDLEIKKRGDKAAALLGDEMLTEAFESVRQALLRKIEESPLRDTDGLVQARLMLKLLRDVRANLEVALRDGKVAAIAIEEQKTGKRFGLF